MVILVLALLIVAGVSLLNVGRRGVATDDHRLCRRCGFDLFGTPGVSVCGECGAGLRRAKSVVVGHRRRRRGMMGLGWSLLVLTVSVAGLIEYGQLKHFDWQYHAPVDYLLYEATSGNAGRRSPALTELNHRSADGRLAPQDWDRVADKGLEYQRDTSKPWDEAWGDLLESMQSAGQLSNDRWLRYATQASANIVLVVRPRVRRGDDVPWSISLRQARVASMSKLEIDFTHDQLIWAGQSIRDSLSIKDGGLDWMSTRVDPRSSFDSSVRASDYPPGLPDGPQSVRATSDVRIEADDGSHQMKTLLNMTLNLPATFVLTPTTVPSVTMVHDPSLAGAIRASIAISPVFNTGIMNGRGFRGAGPSRDIRLNGAPEGLSFVVFVRGADGIESRVGTVACPAGVIRFGDMRLSQAWARPGDIVLRSDPKVAAGTLDVMRAWDGEIVFKNVK